MGSHGILQSETFGPVTQFMTSCVVLYLDSVGVISRGLLWQQLSYFMYTRLDEFSNHRYCKISTNVGTKD